MQTSAGRVTALIAVMAAAVLGGCSSSKSGSSSAHKSFVSQGNAICARYNAQTQPIGEQAGKVIAVHPDQAADLLSQELVLWQKEIGELSALKGPKTDTDHVASALGNIRTQLADGLATIQALRSGQMDEAGRLIDKSNAENDQENKSFDAAGLKTCGSGSEAPSGSSNS